MKLVFRMSRFKNNFIILVFVEIRLKMDGIARFAYFGTIMFRFYLNIFCVNFKISKFQNSLVIEFCYCIS